MSAIEGRSQWRNEAEELRPRLRAAQQALDDVRGDVDAIVVGLGSFEKRKMFQCVYCSIGTPSYIWSTRRICVSRL